MDHQSSSSDDLKRAACQMAWTALGQDNPQAAAEALKNYAALSATDVEVAEVWATMLGWVNDLDHLERESRRLAQKWAKESKVVTAIIVSILKAWKNQPGLEGPADREGVIGLGVDLIDFCLSEAPPSKPQQRAELYILRARLLFYAGPLGDDRALADYEVALSLYPEDAEAWFLLARHHLFRGRWEKSIRATIESEKLGFDELKTSWNLAVAQTALADLSPDMSTSLKDCWLRAKNHDFIDHAEQDVNGRWLSANLERQRVILHSHMIRIGGGWELIDHWQSEIVLVQALSPCHGRILHPCYGQFPADFDDLILWDPHPVDFIDLNGEQRPLMRGLALLEKGKAVVRSFPQVRLDDDQLKLLNEALPKGIFFYQGPDGQNSSELHGKLCWPRSMVAAEVIRTVKVLWSDLNLPMT